MRHGRFMMRQLEVSRDFADYMTSKVRGGGVCTVADTRDRRMLIFLNAPYLRACFCMNLGINGRESLERSVRGPKC